MTYKPEKTSIALTADLTGEQDVSLADLNSSAMDVAKEIKKEGMTPARVKTALDIVGKMHAIHIAELHHNKNFFEVETKDLGRVTEPRMFGDFFVFAAAENGGRNGYIYNQLGKRIGSPQMYQHISPVHLVGDQLAYNVIDSDGHDGILLYNGKSCNVVYPAIKTGNILMQDDIPDGLLVFKSVNSVVKPTATLFDHEGQVIENDPTVTNYGPIRNFNGEIYYVIKTRDNNGHEVENIRTKNPNPNSEFHFDLISADHIIDIFTLPHHDGPNSHPVVYAQICHRGQYFFVNELSQTLPFPRSSEKAEMIHTGSNKYNGRRFAKIKNGQKWYVFSDLQDESVGDPNGYDEIQDFRCIGYKPAFRGRKGQNWVAIYNGTKISNEPFFDISELTDINGSPFYIGQKTLSSMERVYNKFTNAISAPHFLIKDLTDIGGIITFCAQHEAEDKWKIYTCDNQPCSRGFDEVYSLVPGDEKNQAKVLGRIGTKYIMETIDITKTYTESDQDADD